MTFDELNDKITEDAENCSIFCPLLSMGSMAGPAPCLIEATQEVCEACMFSHENVCLVRAALLMSLDK